jgi:hypothetical protein
MGAHLTNGLLRFARQWLDERTVANVFEPLLADHQREWLDAPPAARLRVVIRTAWTFTVALFAVAPRAFLLAPTPASVTRRIIARMIVFVSVVVGVLMLPFLTELREVPAGRLAFLMLLLMPSMLVLAFPFAMGFVVDGVRRRASATPDERLAMLRAAIVAVTVLIVLHGWIMPAANQQLRVTTMSDQWHTPARGARELTTMQLLRHPGPSAAMQREIHDRLSIAVLPLVLIWLRWRALGHRSVQGPLPAWLSATLTIGVYFFLRENDLRIESLLGLASGYAAWAPHAIFLAASGLASRVSDSTPTSVLRA